MWSRLVVLAVVVVAAAACTTDQPPPTASLEVTAPLFAKGGNSDFNLGTHLSGENEVFTPANPGDPTPADSRAQGQAIFRVSDDGSSVSFKLIASNIHNVIMAHIHCGVPGVNGPIRMWLYPNVGPSGSPLTTADGRHDGVLATGTFSPAGVTCPATATTPEMPLLDAIRAGLTYVNVHTNDQVGAPNTGPGDFPGGEIRGPLIHPSSHGRN